MVKARISKSYKGPESGKEVMIKALDYTSGGDEDDVQVLIAGTTKATVKKKFLTDVEELNEYGVYNSETDTQVKTDSNDPSNEETFMAHLIDSIQHLVSTVKEIQQTVEKNSKLSFDSLTVCIGELETYQGSLTKELETIKTANT